MLMLIWKYANVLTPLRYYMPRCGLRKLTHHSCLSYLACTLYEQCFVRDGSLPRFQLIDYLTFQHSNYNFFPAFSRLVCNFFPALRLFACNFFPAFCLQYYNFFPALQPSTCNFFPAAWCSTCPRTYVVMPPAHSKTGCANHFEQPV